MPTEIRKSKNAVGYDNHFYSLVNKYVTITGLPKMQMGTLLAIHHTNLTVGLCKKGGTDGMNAPMYVTMEDVEAGATRVLVAFHGAVQTNGLELAVSGYTAQELQEPWVDLSPTKLFFKVGM